VAVIGALILLALGLFIGWWGVVASAAPGVEGIDLGRAVAPLLLILAAPPIAAGAGVLWRQRWAQVLGIIVGGLYGALFLVISNGSAPFQVMGLAFVGAAVGLLDSLRSRSSR
jgi:hypothetical protein